MSYSLIGKRVRVFLYDAGGQMIGTVEGRVADFAAHVQVAADTHKDLIFVVDIETPDGDVYKNAVGTEGESWFAVHDVEVIDEDQPRLFAN